MSDEKKAKLAALAAESDAIVLPIRRAVRRMLDEHKRLSQPVVLCENGVVRWVPAEEIVVPDEPAAP